MFLKSKFLDTFITTAVSVIVKGQLQRFYKLISIDRFCDVEDGFAINFWKFGFVFV